MLEVATVLAAGLTVLPSSIQEAQANPCSIEAGGATVTQNDDQECDFTGSFEFEEGIGSIDINQQGPPEPDADQDGVPYSSDNCPTLRALIGTKILILRDRLVGLSVAKIVILDQLLH